MIDTDVLANHRTGDLPLEHASDQPIPRQGRDEETFAEKVRLIAASRGKAPQAVNAPLM